MPRPLSLRWTFEQIPRALRWIILATAVVSVAAAVGMRNGATLLGAGLLVTPAVLHGQVWRLVTWVFYELGPLALVFDCLTLYWFGRDVASTLGRRRFLVFYFGLAAIAGAGTCLLGLVWPVIAQLDHGGGWPVVLGVLVAWGTMFPERSLRFWGLPLVGRHLVPIALGGTVLFALFYGLPPFVPHFLAELAALAWLGPIERTRTARKKDLQARAARGEAWSFDAWFDKEKRRRR